jgi:hypothetical protein
MIILHAVVEALGVDPRRLGPGVYAGIKASL